MFFRYGAEDETRTRTVCTTRPSNVRGYQLRHLGLKNFYIIKDYLLTFVFEVVLPALLFSTGRLAVFGAVVVFVASVAGGTTAGASDVVCKTETFPVIAGKDSNKAESINNAAAVIVILDKTDCVPLGPNAVLEILLVNNAPASAFPGCNKTVTIRTRQDIKNRPYNK